MNQIDQQAFSDATIRRFLLAQCSPEQQSAFEESLFVDERLDQRVRLAECELTDDYAFDRLSIYERKLFEQKFLVSSARKHQLTVSKGLRDRVAPITAARRLPLRSMFTERSWFVFNLNQSSWRIAFAVLVFLLLVGTVWLVIKKEPQIKAELTRRVIGKHSSPQTTPFQANHPTNASIPQHEIMPSLQPEHEQTVPVSVALTPELAREKAPSIALPQGEHAVVRFELALKGNQSTEYRAELVTAQGHAVFDGIANRSSSSDVVSFDVPARLLKQADYQIRLLHTHSNATVATYYFQVR